MNKDEILKSLQEQYPENLNDVLKCYWWCTCNADDTNISYHLLLRDRIKEENGEKLNLLKISSPNHQNLVDKLEEYLSANGLTSI